MRLLPANTYTADPALTSLLGAWLSPGTLAWAEPQLVELGQLAADHLPALGDACERQPAWLRPIDPWGDRVDEVVYPDEWRELAAIAARTGLTGMPYEDQARRIAGPDVRVVHAALCYLFQPQTATYLCPVSMTDAAARVLADYGPAPLRDDVLPHLVSRDATRAWTAGQWMTEQQGGSDVGANTVEARRDPSGGWRLHGRKYFCSNVGGEVVLALARPEGAGPGTRGLGLFLVPRLLPGGVRNSYRIDRLKDKLGTRAMATGEVTLEGAHAEPVGELDRGFAQMTAMLNVTRLHNAIASAGTIRRGLQLARGYAACRTAFGQPLDRLPLQRQVLVQLAVQAEAALVLTMRLAALLGRIECGTASVDEAVVFRLGASLTKLYTARQAVAAASEVLEAFGGAGYMEDTGIARLLRDAQVLPIWEGTTNVLSLDALRTAARPGTADAFLAELERLGSPARDAVAAQLAEAATGEPEEAQRSARRLAFAMAEGWISGLLAEAARRGPREAAVSELWESGCEPAAGADRFELVVDGR
ncbi:MAG TPA: acyl-CoA dehydrogenase family protein [Candidatus Dormibacteraeota bacterium]|nr:acyl-CoA dehydrogenase family protein [Candidatus Dormibacteraeota bacterium]